MWRTGFVIAGLLFALGCTEIPSTDDAGTMTMCSCDGRECGDDACGATCGTCPAGQACVAGRCGGCAPSCAGRTCGDDGCGGICGSCAVGASCMAGSCCAPSCDEVECGDDGCGGSCGSCATDQTCNAGRCECSGSSVTCYTDEDGDGYLGTSVVVCGDACPAGSMELGDNELDCLDEPSNLDSATVNPGYDGRGSSTPYCTGLPADCASGSVATSFDYNCDGVEEPRYGITNPTPGLCGVVGGGGCASAGDWFAAETVPECGDAGTLTNCCGTESPGRQECR